MGAGMSETDSFIDEVTDEVRRDRMFLMLRKYGWIAVVVVILVVGGAAYNEYRKASERAAAERLGDEIIAAMSANEAAGRAENLSGIEAGSPGGAAVLAMLRADARARAGQLDTAVADLTRVATDPDLPEIYRHMAGFKALTLQWDTLPAADRRVQFQALAQPGAPLRLLAEEQLALIDISEGDTAAALDRLQALLQDAEATTDLQQRASQLIVALGGTPRPIPAQQG